MERLLMKRVFVLFFVLFSTFAGLYAGPFGLSNGMTFEEVTEACGGKRPQRIENDDRYVIEPTKSHSMFKYYIAWINDEHGLYYVRGISEEIYTNDYGEELKREFYSFKDRVEKIYGTPELVDEMTDSNGLFKDEQYWLYALEKGSRQLYAKWNKDNKKVTLKDDLYFIRLWGAYSGYKKTQLIIDYEFINQEKVENQEDDVL